MRRRAAWLAAAVAGALAIGAIVVLAPRPSSPPPAEVEAPPGSVLIRDSENYLDRQFLAFVGDWSVSTGKERLTRGPDYADSIIIDPRTFPNGSDIAWRWPDRPPQKGVYGYLHLAYGSFAGGATKEPVAPEQVSRIRTLKTLFAVDDVRSDGQFNVLSETFVTRAKGDFSTKALEVGFLTHLSDHGREHFDKARQIGTFTDPGGRRWTVAEMNGFCMFVPEDEPVSSGVLHYDAAFAWLVSKGLLTGNEWFNGLAIGVEPVSGSGGLRVSRWEILYR
jgi:hypothetical protein